MNEWTIPLFFSRILGIISAFVEAPRTASSDTIATAYAYNNG